tara:strand:+ start:2599 stop:2754 length:156 start_codon:yes stop_codon:yes gene_type:complete
MSKNVDHAAMDRVAQKIVIQGQKTGAKITHDQAKRFLAKQLQTAENKRKRG